MCKYLYVIIATIISGYYLFTSGLVYEISGNEVVDTIDTPFTIAFSNERIGFVGTYNEDDIACVEWLESTDDDLPIWTDYMGMSLLIEYIGYGRERYVATTRPHYLFLHTWNIDNNKMVYGWVEASRVYLPLPDVSSYDEVFRSGDSVVYKLKTDDLE